MKTPFDTALRAQRREMDDLSTAIADAARAVAEAERRREAVSEAMARESRLAATDWTFSPIAYLARARAERDHLGEVRRAADADLAALRDQATERYGSLRALEGAADTFREQASRDAAGVEQAGVDDIAGARVAQLLDARRRARGQARASR